MLRTLRDGVLYRNPHPGHRAVCAFLPNVVPLSDREHLCFYRLGQAFYSLDGRLARLRSTDGGATWLEEGLVWDPGKDAVRHTYSAPHGTLLRDGTLIVVAHRYPATEDQLFRFNPETGGSRPVETVLFRSTDRGRSWSEPEVLYLGDDGVIDVPSSIIELNDGSWFIACEVWKTWDDRSPMHIKGYGLFSRDGGRHWGDRVDFPSAADSSRMYSHSRYSRIQDGRICALQWTQSIGGETNFDLHFVVSDETGRRWNLPRSTGIPAQTSWVAHVGGGVLAAAYSVREGMQPGIRVALSRDEGVSWDIDGSVLVWDAVGQEYLGVSHKPSYPASHDNIAFGKPNLAALPNGTLFASWWCTQACVTHIRFVHVAVE
ncbi:MAG: sialidase family protein [Longimicrobiales bacterium]